VFCLRLVYVPPNLRSQVLSNPQVAAPYVSYDSSAVVSGKSALLAAVGCFDSVVPSRPVFLPEGGPSLPFLSVFHRDATVLAF
jgi:hypothetical protein